MHHSSDGWDNLGGFSNLNNSAIIWRIHSPNHPNSGLLLTPLQRWTQSYTEKVDNCYSKILVCISSAPHKLPRAALTAVAVTGRKSCWWLTCWLPLVTPPWRGRSPGASWGSPLAWLSISQGVRCAVPARCSNGAHPPRRHSPATSPWGAPWSSGGSSPLSTLLEFWNTRKSFSNCSGSCMLFAASQIHPVLESVFAHSEACKPSKLISLEQHKYERSARQLALLQEDSNTVKLFFLLLGEKVRPGIPCVGLNLCPTDTKHNCSCCS